MGFFFCLFDFACLFLSVRRKELGRVVPKCCENGNSYDVYHCHQNLELTTCPFSFFRFPFSERTTPNTSFTTLGRYCLWRNRNQSVQFLSQQASPCSSICQSYQLQWRCLCARGSSSMGREHPGNKFHSVRDACWEKWKKVQLRRDCWLVGVPRCPGWRCIWEYWHANLVDWDELPKC